MNIKIIKVKNNEDLQICSDLRKEVFGNEENAPEELYIVDKFDKLDTTCNYLLKLDSIPVATIRFIKVNDTVVKIQRLVVLSKYRGNGYAKLLLEYLEKDVFNLGYKKIVMDSAEKAVGFYEKYGYKKVSDIFYEDNRPHIKMEKELNF